MGWLAEGLPVPPVNAGKNRVGLSTPISCREISSPQDRITIYLNKCGKIPAPLQLLSLPLPSPTTNIYIGLSPSFQSPCWRGQQRVLPVSPVPIEALQNSTCLLSVCLYLQASSAKLEGQDLSLTAACSVLSLSPSIITELALLYFQHDALTHLQGPPRQVHTCAQGIGKRT